MKKQHDITIVAPLKSIDDIDDLQLLLENNREFLPFYNHPSANRDQDRHEIENLHFASLFIIFPPIDKSTGKVIDGHDGFLVLEANIDSEESEREAIKQFLDGLLKADHNSGHQVLHKAFSFCKAYQSDPYDRYQLLKYLLSNNKKSNAFYVANRGLSAEEIFQHEQLRKDTNDQLQRLNLSTPAERQRVNRKFGENNSDSTGLVLEKLNKARYRMSVKKSERPYLLRYGETILKMFLALITVLIFVTLAISSTLLGSHTSIVENYLVLGSIALIVITTILLIVINKIFTIIKVTSITKGLKYTIYILPVIIGIGSFIYIVFFGESVRSIINMCEDKEVKLVNIFDIFERCDLNILHYSAVSLVLIGFFILGLFLIMWSLNRVYSSDEEDELITKLTWTIIGGLLLTLSVMLTVWAINKYPQVKSLIGNVIDYFNLSKEAKGKVGNFLEILGFGARGALALVQMAICVLIATVFLRLSNAKDDNLTLATNPYFVVSGILIVMFLILTLGRQELPDDSIFFAQVSAVVLFGVLMILVLAICRIRRLEREDPEDEIPWNSDSKFREVIDKQELVRDTFATQNHLISITDIKPGRLRNITLRVILWVIGLAHKLVQNKGSLGGLTTIHFARWVIIDKGRRLLFLSNYDGDWGQYLSDFIDGPVVGLTAIWSNTQGFPRTKWLTQYGANDEQRFKAYARNSQLPSIHWYTRYPDLSVKNVQDNEHLNNWVAELQAKSEPNPELKPELKPEPTQDAEFESATRYI